jgi:hypothetical protein
MKTLAQAEAPFARAHRERDELQRTMDEAGVASPDELDVLPGRRAFDGDELRGTKFGPVGEPITIPGHMSFENLNGSISRKEHVDEATS